MDFSQSESQELFIYIINTINNANSLMLEEIVIRCYQDFCLFIYGGKT